MLTVASALPAVCRTVMVYCTVSPISAVWRSPVLLITRPVASAVSSGMWLWTTPATDEPPNRFSQYCVSVPTAPVGAFACGCTGWLLPAAPAGDSEPSCGVISDDTNWQPPGGVTDRPNSQPAGAAGPNTNRQ